MAEGETVVILEPLDVFGTAMAESIQGAPRAVDGQRPSDVRGAAYARGVLAGLDALRSYMQEHDVLLGPGDEDALLRWVPVVS